MTMMTMTMMTTTRTFQPSQPHPQPQAPHSSGNSSKRKGDFSPLSSSSSKGNPPHDHGAVVMVQVEPKGTPEKVGMGRPPHYHRVLSLKPHLQQRRSSYFLDRTKDDDDDDRVNEDPLSHQLIESMEHKKKERQHYLDQLKKDSTRIQDDLNRRIVETQEVCQMESNVLAEQSRYLHQLQELRDQLLQQIDDMDQRQVELHHQIALHQQETTEEMEVMDRVEEERKREVPRLKHTLSLYASTTGIKWDFLQHEVLSGSVAIPDRQGFRLFSIDPSDHDSVEVANQLWRLIEGGSPCQ